MNWGWKLAIGSGLFMAMILYFVVQSFQNETHLVSQNYYEEELKFQNKMEATKNAKSLGDEMVVTQSNGQIHISYPKAIKFGDEANGTLHFYNVVNGHSDKLVECDFTAHNQSVAIDKFNAGPYMVRADIQVDGKDYYFEKRLTIN